MVKFNLLREEYMERIFRIINLSEYWDEKTDEKEYRTWTLTSPRKDELINKLIENPAFPFKREEDKNLLHALYEEEYWEE